MNALVSIDVATLTPATVFAPGGVEAIIAKIEAEVSAEIFTIDSAEGRERIKSVAYKVARSKTALDDMGKELVAGIKAQAGAIDADRRTIRDRLDALKERVRGPLTAWEDAEAGRIGAHESALVSIIESPRMPSPTTADHIRARVASVRDLCKRDWQEFHERAEAAATEALARLGNMLEIVEQQERDAAELAELRQLKAERDARDAAEAIAKQEAARLERQLAEAAERERIRAEQQAERDRQNAERADREKIEAAARAVEQERERVARVKAEEERAAAKREANKKHRQKIHREILDAFTAYGTEKAHEIADAIIDGKIPHVSVTY